MSDAAVTLRTTGRLGAVLKITPETLSADMSEKVEVIDMGQSRFDSLVDRSISGEVETNALTIGKYCFEECRSILSVKAPNATKIDVNAFYNCTALVSCYAPNATTISGFAFNATSALVSVYAPKVITIGAKRSIKAALEKPVFLNVQAPISDMRKNLSARLYRN